MCSTARSIAPIARTTRSGRSAPMAARSSRARGASRPPTRACHPAHGLGLQPVRREFRQHHAAARRDARRRSTSSPTNGACPTSALDIADAIFAIARRLRAAARDRRACTACSIWPGGRGDLGRISPKRSSPRPSAWPQRRSRVKPDRDRRLSDAAPAAPPIRGSTRAKLARDLRHRACRTGATRSQPCVARLVADR